MRRPGDCTCRFPEVLARNPTGHDINCPAHARLSREIAGSAQRAPAPEPGPGDDLCRCPCHEPPPRSAMFHVLPCCTWCDRCRERIASDRFEAHRARCRVVQEDRGTAVHVWCDPHEIGTASFVPRPGYSARFTISAPIGWMLKSDPDFGVVLARPSLGPEHVLYAGLVLDRAIARRDGFRVRESPPGWASPPAAAPARAGEQN